MLDRSKSAAQYIRMSTDTQNLSPQVQKEAIEAYALVNDMTVVASYEDEARSGVTLRNRAEMRKLLSDVIASDCAYSTILVYDVSRWGRFQDADESAYYEYHCRKNGVEVIYVREQFDRERTPLSDLLKALKRTMAAEFSRELGVKVRDAQRKAVALGFQFGRLPAIGIDRVGVLPGGLRRPLARDERPRKGERVAWIAGPAEELRLVRRIFREYVGSDVTIAGLVRRLNAEGHSARGRPFTQSIMKCLLASEIFYGEFTWGRRKSGARKQRRGDGDPAIMRSALVMDPVVSKSVWTKAQEKRRALSHQFDRTKESLLADLRRAFVSQPGLAAQEMMAHGCAHFGMYKKHFGSVRAAMHLAGRDEAEMDRKYRERKGRTSSLSNQVGRDLQDLFDREGLSWSVLGRERVIFVESKLRLQFKVIWEHKQRMDSRWRFQRAKSPEYDYVLLMLMLEDETANEMLLLSREQFGNLRTCFLVDQVDPSSRIKSARALTGEIRRLCGAT